MGFAVEQQTYTFCWVTTWFWFSRNMWLFDWKFFIWYRHGGGRSILNFLPKSKYPQKLRKPTPKWQKIPKNKNVSPQKLAKILHNARNEGNNGKSGMQNRKSKNSFWSVFWPSKMAHFGSNEGPKPANLLHVRLENESWSLLISV